MAVELESCNINMSPRISFSHDFCQSDSIPVEQQQQQKHPFRSNSTGIDFDFCVRKSFDQESSSADELFSDGKILPLEVKPQQKQKQKQKQNNKAVLPLPKDQQSLNLKPAGSSNNNNNNKIMRDEAGDDDDDLEENTNNNNNKQSSSKSFWKFKRSSSLNCGSSYGRSLCPLPPLLSRSNSTGSASNDKRAALSKDGSNKSSSSVKSSYLKPPLKKNYGSYGNIGTTVHVNPVLNVPSGNLFGLGSIFSKDHKNKKK